MSGIRGSPPVRIERRGESVAWNEELAFTIFIAQCHGAVDAMRPARFHLVYPVDGLRNGIESVHPDQVTKQLPPGMFTTLHTYVDHDKWFMQQAVLNYPPREWRLVVMVKIHKRYPDGFD